MLEPYRNETNRDMTSENSNHGPTIAGLRDAIDGGGDDQQPVDQKGHKLSREEVEELRRYGLMGVVSWQRREEPATAEERREQQERAAEEEEEDRWCERVQAVVSNREHLKERPLPATLLPELRICSLAEASDAARLAATGVTHVFSCILAPPHETEYEAAKRSLFGREGRIGAKKQPEAVEAAGSAGGAAAAAAASASADVVAACDDSAPLVYGGVSSKDEEGYPMLDLHFDEFKRFMDEAIAEGTTSTSNSGGVDEEPEPEPEQLEPEESNGIELGGRRVAEKTTNTPNDNNNSNKAVRPTKSKKTAAVVAVHCVAGVNRSGALAVAYVAQSRRWPLLRALRHCCRARGPLVWNATFQRQLVRFCKKEGLLIVNGDDGAAAEQGENTEAEGGNGDSGLANESE